MLISGLELKKTLWNVQGPTKHDFKGTVISFEGIFTNDVGLTGLTVKEYGDAPYTSDYWQSMPTGEYTLYATQGGIRNREIPKAEKAALRQVIWGRTTMKGTCLQPCRIKLVNSAGKILQIAVS